MLKSSNKKFFAVSLASFAVISAFTGCSKDNGKGSGKEDVPEYVYEPTFNDLGTINVDYINQPVIKDGNIYMTGSHYEMDKKGDSGKSINYFMTGSFDSEKIDMSEIKGLKKDESTNRLFIDEEGNMRILTSVYIYNKKQDNGQTKYFLSKLDKNSKISGRIELKPDVKKNEEFYMGGSMAYTDGKLITASDETIYIFNKDGSMAKKTKADSYVDGVFATSGNKVYIMGNMEKAGGNGICELDIKTGKLGEPSGFGDYSLYNIKSVQQGSDGTVYAANDDGIYKYSLDTKKTELLFNWLNVDINGSNVSDFQITEDGNLIVISTAYNYDSDGNGGSTTSSLEIATLEKKKYSESKQKKRLTLAINYASQELKEEILKYNKTNEDYRIDIKSYNSYEDPQKQMNLDIISGDVPDIIDMSGLSKSMYIKKGLLTDLYPLMEKDGQVKKDDFIDSVINTIEHDGKLYYMPTSFSISAFAGSKKIFNGMEGWTYEEMEEKYNSLPEGRIFTQGMTSDWFIQNMVSSQIDDFINFETGEVSLDSEEFIHMLEFSKNFQTADEYIKEQEENNWKREDITELVNSGRLLLNNMYLYDFVDIQVNEKLYKKQGGYDVISQPSKDKNNKLTMNSSDTCLAISSKCSDKDGAWKFLVRLYAPDYQKKTSKYNGFPIRKDILEKKIEYAMATKKYTDDDGTEVTPIEGDTYSIDDFSVTIKPYTKAHMDLFRSMVDRIGKEDAYDTFITDINEIITEETKAFFAGDKTAKETAEVLQSRVKIYVSENS